MAPPSPPSRPAESRPVESRPAGSGPASRRRQRSARVSAAVGLLCLATVVVLAAVTIASATLSTLWLSAASLFALACGWAAARIVATELAQTRRDAAVDRAAQARAYRDLFAVRADEHAAFSAAMTDRLARSEIDRRELEGALALSQRRTAEAELRVKREARRANEAQEKVAELTLALEVQRAETVDELASWAG